MAKAFDPIREANRALSRLKQAQQLMHTFPEDLYQSMGAYPYLVECALSRLEYLMQHAKPARQLLDSARHIERGGV